MSNMHVVIPEDLEDRFRKAVGRDKGAYKGAIKDAIREIVTTYCERIEETP